MRGGRTGSAIAEILKAMAAAMSIFFGVADRSHAGFITQTVGFHLASHGTTFGQYKQFDPTLGSLNDVTISISGTAKLDSFIFSNNTNSFIIFTGFVETQFSIFVGSVDIKTTFSETLGAYQVDQPRSVSGPFGGNGDFKSTDGPLLMWIGTGLLSPDIFLPPNFSIANSNNINISVKNFNLYTYNGTESITYFYNGTTPDSIPEPSSWVMGGTAALAVFGGALHRRRPESRLAGRGR